MKKVTLWLPLVAVLLSVFVLVRPIMPKQTVGAYNLDALGKLPVSAGGRTKPLDSVARNSLMIISDRQTATANNQRISAMRWMADVISQRPETESYEVFRIDHPDVRSLLGEVPDKQKRFSFNQLLMHSQAINEQLALVRGIDPKDFTIYQKHLMELADHVQMFQDIRHRLTPYMLPPLSPGENWRPLAPEMVVVEGHPDPSVAAQYWKKILDAYQQQNPQEFNQQVAEYTTLLNSDMPAVMRKAKFEVFFNNLQPFYQGTVLYVLAFLLGAIALLASNIKNGTLAIALRRAMVSVIVVTFIIHTFGLAARVYMQGYAPVTNLYSSAVFIGWFCVAMGLFMEWLFKNGLGSCLSAVIGFVTLIIAHNLADGDTMQMMQAVLDSNFWLTTHVIAVTIGYSAMFMAGVISIVFVALAVHGQCVSEYRGRVLATLVGASLFTLVAIALAIVLTLFAIPQFAIRSVLLLTGYTSLFYVIFVGAVYLLSLLPWRPDTSEVQKILGKMIYGTIAFALLFSFVGTVLGGIWADQSWGRFWGWDPKENGAVLIVLMNALILHARWGGMIRMRGVAVLAVFGNIVTAWSWFGTNMLGVGLHSYGFMDKAVIWMLIFVGSQLAIMTAGMLPIDKWKSHPTQKRRQKAAAEAPQTT